MNIHINKDIDTDMFFIFSMIATATSFIILLISMFSRLNYESIAIYYVGVNLGVLLATWMFGDK